jgi:hypothetical protein
MKKIFFLILAGILTFFSTINMYAQGKAETKLSSITQKGETVRYTLTSSRPFIVGNNTYILHIDGRDFSQYEQSANKETGVITFLIPIGDFSSLTDGKSVYLTYGAVSVNADMENLASKSARCWVIGKLNKDVLNK